MNQGNAAVATKQKSMSTSRKEELQPSQDFIQYLRDYARAKPDVAALWCFGVGFVIGWKLKPW